MMEIRKIVDIGEDELSTAAYRPRIEVIQSRIQKREPLIHLPFGGRGEIVDCVCCEVNWAYSDPELVIRPEKPVIEQHEGPDISMGCSILTEPSFIREYFVQSPDYYPTFDNRHMYGPNVYRARHLNRKELEKEEWFDRHKLRHRDFGPAVIRLIPDSNVHETWYNHGRIHNSNGPAALHYVYGELRLASWYENDVLHRIDGPAVEQYMNGKVSGKGWFWRGTALHGIEAAIKKGTDGIVEFLRQAGSEFVAVVEIAFKLGLITHDFYDALMATRKLHATIPYVVR